MESASDLDNVEAVLRQNHIGVRRDASTCCCGRSQCAYLAHNNAALEGLEKDLLSAARIGQALLSRHENHMAEAEAERCRMIASIERLEIDNRVLQVANAKIIEENRGFLDQLEDLNNLVTESDAEIQRLTGLLDSTRQELNKLTVLAGRATALETQLTNMEVDHAELQAQLASSDDINRSAMQRWKRAEVTIEHLQEQIDRIEKEAIEEREKHVEVLGRMERRKAVENELQNASRCLKASAASSNLEDHKDGANVVSHFVKDILQDNANLQMGVMELREMLMESNAEVEKLREQLQAHQPMGGGDNSQTSLQMELLNLNLGPGKIHKVQEAQHELHIHHHYHKPESITKKPRRRRSAVAPGNSGPPLSASNPRAQRIRDWRSAAPAAAATILSQTSVTVPLVNHQHRWSAQSTQTTVSLTPSSVPSSPQYASSIFDNIDGAFESSRPTTPESSVPSSPKESLMDIKTRKVPPRMVSNSLPIQAVGSQIDGRMHLSSGSDGSRLLYQNDESMQPLHNMTDFILSPPGQDTIVEEDEFDLSKSSTTALYDGNISGRPRIYRSVSHESLISVSALESRTVRGPRDEIHYYGTLSPSSLRYARGSYTKPIATATTTNGVPMFNKRIQDSGEYTRSILFPSQNNVGNKHTLGRKVGEWVWSKWGVAPMTPSEHLRSRKLQNPLEAILRSPGVNQKGPILGISRPRPTPSNVRPGKIDIKLLQESLAEV